MIDERLFIVERELLGKMYCYRTSMNANAFTVGTTVKQANDR